MAVKKSRRVKMPEAMSMPEPMVFERPKRNWKKWGWVVVAVGLLVGWWWWSNSWPVIAVVNGKMVTRGEVMRTLYAQSGEAILDSIVTQKLVEDELNRMGVVADPAKVEERIGQMKADLPQGSTWEAELATRGITEKQIRELLSLQIRLGAAVEKDATVSAEEIATYVKENEKFMTGKTPDERKTEAEGILKQSKQGTAIEALISRVREEGQSKVWRLPSKK